jgi:hypothetical protein
VIHDGQPLVLAEREAIGIVEQLAAIEPAALEHPLDEGPAADPRMIEILVPEGEVLDRSQKACGSDRPGP